MSLHPDSLSIHISPALVVARRLLVNRIFVRGVLLRGELESWEPNWEPYFGSPTAQLCQRRQIAFVLGDPCLQRVFPPVHLLQHPVYVGLRVGLEVLDQVVANLW